MTFKINKGLENIMPALTGCLYLLVSIHDSVTGLGLVQCSVQKVNLGLIFTPSSITWKVSFMNIEVTTFIHEMVTVEYGSPLKETLSNSIH